MDMATTAADVGPGQVSLGTSDLAQDIPVPAEALKNIRRAATPWIHCKLRMMEIGGGVCVSLECTLILKENERRMEKYFLTAVRF